MSSVAKWDIEITQGSTFRLRFTWFDLDGVAVDLTGYGGRMEVRTEAGGTLLHEIDSSASEIVFDDAGHVDVTIGHVKTETPGAEYTYGVYDLFLFPSDNRTGIPFAIVRGKVKYNKRVTDYAS